MLREFEDYLLSKEEPVRSCLVALDEIVFRSDDDIKRAWKYRMPMYTYRGKMFCYLWIDKKTGEPYIGFVEGSYLEFPELEQGNRARMKILRIAHESDIPVDLINAILTKAREFYQVN